MRFMLNPLLSWLTVQGLLPCGDTDASGQLERLPATVAGFLPRLPVPSHDAHEIYSPEPGLGTARPAGRAGRHGRNQEDVAPISRGPGVSQRAADLAADPEEEPEYAAPATRIALRPHDPHT